jgi:hypothetical protein
MTTRSRKNTKKICRFAELCLGFSSCEKKATTEAGFCEEHQRDVDVMDENARKEKEKRLRLSSFPLHAKEGHVFLIGGWNDIGFGLLVVSCIPKQTKVFFEEVPIANELGDKPRRVFAVFERKRFENGVFLHIDTEHPRCRHAKTCECSLKQESTIHKPLLFLPALPDSF